VSPLDRALAALSGDPGILLDEAGLSLELAAARRCPREAPDGVLEFWIQTPERPRAGAIELRFGEPAANPILSWLGHVGFVVHPESRGQSLALRASRMLLPLARASGLEQLTLTCAAGNEASEQTLRRLGAILAGLVRAPKPSADWGEPEEVPKNWRRRFILSLAPTLLLSPFRRGSLL
jgi:RimJ/RimL family protein N-acetyltransferase